MLLQRLPGHGVPGFPFQADRRIGFSYDLNGNTAQIDPPPARSQYSGGSSLQAEHRFIYDLVNQLTSYDIRDHATPSVPLGLATTYGYTPDRKLKTVDRPEQDQMTYSSALGRHTGIDLPGGLGSVGYGFSPTTGHLTSLTGPMDVDLGFGYDGHLMTDVTWSGLSPSVGDVTLHRAFDAHFRVTAETLTGAPPLYFNYDNDDLLTCVGTAATADCAGGLRVDRANGSTLLATTAFPYGESPRIDETYTPNGFGETMGYAAMVGATSLFTTDYTRDDLGRIATRDESLQNPGGGLSSYSYAYIYDAAGRLTDVTIGSPASGTHVHYDLDANGNRLRRSVEDLGTSTLVSEEFGEYNLQGQLTHYAGKTYAYTASGYLETVTDDATSEVTRYTYDALGNLRRVELPDGTDIDYVVDGMNRRVARARNGMLTTAWVYEDQLRIAAEFDFATDGAVSATKRFAYGTKSNAPDLMIMNGVRYRILSDHLGSARLLVSEDGGTILARMDYDEYGRPAAGNTTGVVPFGFAGGLYDHETGLVRFGARDYDAVVGRWTARDSLLFDFLSKSGMQDESLAAAMLQGWNWYGYVGSDPVNRVDLNGFGYTGGGGTSGGGGSSDSYDAPQAPPGPGGPAPGPSAGPGACSRPGDPGSPERKWFCFGVALGVYGTCMLTGKDESECRSIAFRFWMRCTNTG